MMLIRLALYRHVLAIFLSLVGMMLNGSISATLEVENLSPMKAARYSRSKVRK